MAPILSKIPSPDAQSSFPSINQLTDDSLLVLLSLLPLDALLNQVNLACKRWHVLLPLVLCKRHSLILYAYPIDLPTRNQFFNIQNKTRLPSAQYAAYLNSLLRPAKPRALPWASPCNLKYALRVDQFVKASLGKFLASHFGSLTHLSLVNIKFQLKTLQRLLTTYRDSLQCLAIKNLVLSDQRPPECSCYCPNDASTNGLLSQEENLAHLWPLIDSMTVLRRLAISFFQYCLKHPRDSPHQPSLQLVLPNLLPRLVSFTLDGYDLDIGIIIETLNGEILTELTLFNCGFIAVNPIVSHCPGLRHLGISTNLPLCYLLQEFAQLPRLTSLQLVSIGFLDLFNTFYQKGDPILTSLRRLSIQTLLDPQTFTILPCIAPNLRQLFLERATLQLDENYWIPLNTSDPMLIEKLANSKQMTELIRIINSFAFLPKIESASELKFL